MQQNPPGRFDYLWESCSEPDKGTGYEDPGYEDLGYDGHGLDARRDPVPWYLTSPSVIALGAIGVAVIAILVSAVLLVSRQSHGQGSHVDPSVTTTATTPSPPPSSPASSPASSTSPPPPETSSSPTESASQIAAPSSPPPKPPTPHSTATPARPRR
ncbi:MAG TPA: hypothetical protein VMU34_15100 [Mycobacterium sp.]|nr:hypothetical protein [Mycobacterium sp.]